MPSVFAGQDPCVVPETKQVKWEDSHILGDSRLHIASSVSQQLSLLLCAGYELISLRGEEAIVSKVTAHWLLVAYWQS